MNEYRKCKLCLCHFPNQLVDVCILQALEQFRQRPNWYLEQIKKVGEDSAIIALHSRMSTYTDTIGCKSAA